jgi:hypothetical protein
VNGGEVRPELEHPAEQVDRHVKPTDLGGDEAEQAQAVHMSRIDREYLADAGFGLRQSAGLEMRGDLGEPAADPSSLVDGDRPAEVAFASFSTSGATLSSVHPNGSG